VAARRAGESSSSPRGAGRVDGGADHFGRAGVAGVTGVGGADGAAALLAAPAALRTSFSSTMLLRPGFIPSRSGASLGCTSTPLYSRWAPTGLSTRRKCENAASGTSLKLRLLSVPSSSSLTNIRSSSAMVTGRERVRLRPCSASTTTVCMEPWGQRGPTAHCSRVLCVKPTL
jgi:hypothetical protein